MDVYTREVDRPMPIRNADIAAVFDEIADLLEIEGENAFRVRAYRNAAREIQALGEEAADMIAKGENLTELPGIGKDLAGKINEIVATGECEALEQLRRRTPSAITALLKVPGLGPKRVHTLYHALHVQTVDELARAAREGRIRDLPRFGPKIEQTILDALGAHIAEQARFPLADAARYGEPLKLYLGKIPGVENVIIAGSYRRRRETVADLDFIVVTTDPPAVMNALVAYSQVKDVLANGVTRASVRLKSGLQVDLRAVARESLGAALLYFTGSKAHNIALRRLAQTHKLKINEYGVFKGTRRIAGDTEESVYATLGLRWIPPEARENRGEIEAARLGAGNEVAAPALQKTPLSRKHRHDRTPSNRHR